MKKIKLELRMYIAELLLNLSFDVAPNNKDGKFLRTIIGEYAKEKVKQYKGSNEI